MTKKILIAEDERDIRDLIKYSLQLVGFEVILTTNGVEAVELAQSEQPDLIIMDVRMPKMTGYQALEALKSNPRTAHIPIVFLTARPDRDRASSMEGVEDFILKPFEIDYLARRVQEILERTASTGKE